MFESSVISNPSQTAVNVTGAAFAFESSVISNPSQTTMTTPTDSQKMKSPMRTGEALFVQIFICQLRRLWRLFLFGFNTTV